MADATVALGHGPHDPSVRGHGLETRQLLPLLGERCGRPNRVRMGPLLPLGEWDASSAARLPCARFALLTHPLRNKRATLLENSRPSNSPPRLTLRRRALTGPDRWWARQPPGVVKPRGGGTGGHLLGDGLLQLCERGQRPVCKRLPARSESWQIFPCPHCCVLPATQLRRAAAEQRSVTTWWSRRLRAL